MRLRNILADLHKLECVAWRYIRWEVLIDDLAEAGHRNSSVARAINVPPQTLDDWKRGAEPRYSKGEALMLVHARVFGNDFTANRIKEFRSEALMRSTDPEKQTGERTNAESRRESCRTG